MNKKTIKIHQYTLDVYENGEIFCHEQVVVRGDGRLQVIRPHYKTQADNGNGYMYIKLWINKRVLSFYVHRLVATAFHPNEDNLQQVNHIDGIRNNNHYSNLEWCTASYNVQDYVKKGRGVYKWKSIIQFDNEGNIIETHRSLSDAAKKLNCTPENIGMAMNKTGKSKTAAGFFWLLKEEYNPLIHTKSFIEKFFVNDHKKGIKIIKNGQLVKKCFSKIEAIRFITGKNSRKLVYRINDCLRENITYLGYNFEEF